MANSQQPKIPKHAVENSITPGASQEAARGDCEAADLRALAPVKRGLKPDPHRAEVPQMAQLTQPACSDR